MGERPSAGRPARVLLCDDSLVIRGAVGRMLRNMDDIEVAASVGNGQAAVDAVRAHRDRGEPIDVAILDIEMPVMDGLTAVPHLLEADPALRIIMSSTLTTRGASVAMEALRRGAADYVPKPSTAGLHGDEAFREELATKVRGLARLGAQARRPCRRTDDPTSRLTAPSLPCLPPPATGPLARVGARPALLAVGSSTGGPQALFELFRGLGKGIGIPVVVTQHMPPTFVAMLAEHLTKLGGLPCRVAADGDPVRPDVALIAPGDRHLVFEAGGDALRARLSEAPPENYCRPSVDTMLRSAHAAFGGRVLVVMLTGMGRDGLEGTRLVVGAGGAALAQDEATSVVWGMPGAVAQAGLARAVLPVAELAGTVRRMVGGMA